MWLTSTNDSTEKFYADSNFTEPYQPQVDNKPNIRILL